MTGVINPIIPGYAWGQAFRFPPGFLQSGDVLAADFRQSAAGVLRYLQARSGVEIARDGDDVSIRLSGEQTATMTGQPAVWTGFTIVRGAKSFPYRQEFRVPVRAFVTRNPQ